MGGRVELYGGELVPLQAERVRIGAVVDETLDAVLAGRQWRAGEERRGVIDGEHGFDGTDPAVSWQI